MRVTRKSHLLMRGQNWGFVIVFLAIIGLLAWVSTRYVYQADWTYGRRNSLSPASVKLLDTLTAPLTVTAYARDNSALRDAIRQFIGRYQRVKKDTTLTFINPDTDPQAARSAGITANGELVIGYQGRSDHVTQISEVGVTNAIERIARSADDFVVFLTGDGERDPRGQHNFDLGDFGTQLTQKGFKVETLNLATTPSIPENTAILVVAGPQANLLPGAVKIIDGYVQRGGNLLWLNDPGPLYGLEPLARELGITFGKGTIVDPDSQLLGINNPAVVLVAKYNSSSAITQGFNNVTAFAGATSISTVPGSPWQASDFLETLSHSWLETGSLEGTIKFDPAHGDQKGPLAIGVSLTREIKQSADNASGKQKSIEQRVVVTGDGDFLSNAYLNNGGNLLLGLNIFNWLAHEDNFVNINPESAPDRTLMLSKSSESLISLGFLFIIPIGLIVAGILIWSRRRRA